MTAERAPIARRHGLWLGAVLIAVAVLTLPKFGNQFVIDDTAMILDAEIIRDPANWRAIVTNNSMYSAGQPGSALQTWRPLTILTFVWDWQVSGQQPWGYHLTNLLGHLVCVALTFFVALRLLGRQAVLGASLAAFAFGVHPLMAEAHVWINGRSDIFGTLWILAAALTLGRWRDDRVVRSSSVWLVAGAVFFVAACLSKETALPLFAALFLLDPVLLEARWRQLTAADWLRASTRMIPFGVAAATYLVFRSLVLVGVSAAGDSDLVLAARNLGILWFESLRGYVAPTTTAMRYLYGEWSLLPAGVFVVTWAIALIVLGLAWRARQRVPVLLIAIVAIYASVAPVAVISVVAGWPGFGRYLYPAAPFAFVAIAQLLHTAHAALVAMQRPSLVRGLQVAVGAWLVGLTVAYLATIQTYRDLETFATTMIDEAPLSAAGYTIAAKHYFDVERFADAVPMYEAALAIDPDTRDNWLGLGLARLFTGDLDGALRAAEEGVNRDAHPGDFYNLAALALMNRNPEQAAQALLDCLVREPDHRPCLDNIERLTTVHPAAEQFRAAFAAHLALARYARLSALRARFSTDQPR